MSLSLSLSRSRRKIMKAVAESIVWKPALSPRGDALFGGNENENENENNDENNDENDDDIEIQEPRRARKHPGDNNHNQCRLELELESDLESDLEFDSRATSSSCSTTSSSSISTTITSSQQQVLFQQAAAMPSWPEETRIFLELATANTLTSLVGGALCPLFTASYVGRFFGPVYLAAFSLANLTVNLCTQTIVFGFLDAIDTLGPQALAKGDLATVGLLSVRGMVVSMAVLVPINAALVLPGLLEDALVGLGEDPVAAYHAQRWYNIFVVSLPFSVGFQMLCRFLTVQNITTPVIVVSLLVMSTISPVLEWVTTETRTRNEGFLGTAVACVGFSVLQFGLLLAYVVWRQPHDPRTWPSAAAINSTTTNDDYDDENENDDDDCCRGGGGGGSNCSSASSSSASSSVFTFTTLYTKPLSLVLRNACCADRAALREFVLLGLGAVVAQSEWVFWEALGLLVGTFGIVPMTVHTIPNQITENSCILAFSVGSALAVRMGRCLSVPTPTTPTTPTSNGYSSVLRAQILAVAVVLAAIIFYGGVSWALYTHREWAIGIFVDSRDDPTSTSPKTQTQTQQTAEVWDLAESIWPEASYNVGISCLFGVLVGISTGLGKQWDLARTNVIGLWVVGMPVIVCASNKARAGSDSDSGSGGGGGDGLKAAWFWMNVAYTCICGALILDFCRTDWYQVRDDMVLRANGGGGGCGDDTDSDSDSDTGSEGESAIINEGGTFRGSSEHKLLVIANETTALL